MKTIINITRKLMAGCVITCCLTAHSFAQTQVEIDVRRAANRAKAEEMRLYLERATAKMIEEAEARRKLRPPTTATKPDVRQYSFGDESNGIEGDVSATVRLIADGAFLSWTSAPNAHLYYDIYFRTNFDDPTESWFMLEQGYPSQGTNTVWKDTGYWGLVSLPGQDPTRFYKIVGWTNSMSPPVVSITLPTGVLSSSISVNASVVSTAAVMAVRLYVDGERIDEIDGSGTFNFDTANFADGDHTIFVTAESESGFESTEDPAVNSFDTTANGLSAMIVRTFSNGVTTNSSRPYPAIPLTNTFGIMFQSHHPYWQKLGPNVNWPSPWNGLNMYVTLANEATTPRPYGALRSVFRIADGFMVGLGRVGHQPKFFLDNEDMTRRGDMLKAPAWGGASKFSTVNFGFLIGHGVRGISYDYTTGFPGVKDTYFPLWEEGDDFYDWVSLSQCDFGSENLRWMAILSCNNLSQPNLDDLYTKKFSNFAIMNENLHLLLGAGSTIYMVSKFGRVFGDACVKGTNGTPMSIREAWFYAGTQTQAINNPHPGVPVYFTVVGYPDCWYDTIYNFNDPDLEDLPMVETRQVYP